MILYPAIDLKDGKAVRLLRGDMNKSTIFNDNPVDQALSFVSQHCQWLHLVDLNGAFSGKPINSAPLLAANSICSSASAKFASTFEVLVICRAATKKSVKTLLLENQFVDYEARITPLSA